MDSADLVACIGKPLEAPEVQSLLASLGVTGQIEMFRPENLAIAAVVVAADDDGVEPAVVWLFEGSSKPRAPRLQPKASKQLIQIANPDAADRS